MESVDDDAIFDNNNILTWQGSCVAVQSKTKDGVAFRIKFRVKLAYLKKTNGGTETKKPLNAKKQKKSSKPKLFDDDASVDEEEMDFADRSDDEEDLFGEKEDDDLVVDDEMADSPSSGKKRKYEEILKTQSYVRKWEKTPKPGEPFLKSDVKEKPSIFADFVVSGFECNHIKSPMLVATIKVKVQSKINEIVYELLEIVNVARPKKITVKLFKATARSSLMFDAYSAPTTRSRLLNAIFDDLGSSETELKEMDDMRKILIKNVHEDIHHFCHNSLRSEATFDLTKAIGWTIPSLLTDKEVASLPTLYPGDLLDLLRKLLFGTTNHHHGAVLTERGIDYFGAKSGELHSSVAAIAKAAEIYKRLKYDTSVRYNSCAKKRVGDGQYDITQLALDQFDHLKTLVHTEVDFDGKVTLTLKQIYDEEQLFCKAFASIPETHFIDSQCNINHHHVQNRYLDMLFKFEASTEYTIVFSTPRRMALLKSLVATTTNLIDFSETFPFITTESVDYGVQRLLQTLKHCKRSCTVVLEESHMLSVPKMSFFFRVLKRLWNPLRIHRLILCGNRFCFPEAPGKPFADLVQTFPNAERLTTLHDSTLDQRKPKQFFEDAGEFANFLNSEKFPSQSIDIFVSSEDRLKSLKTFFGSSKKHSIGFHLYSNLTYNKGCSPFVALDLFENDEITMTKLYKALAVAPLKIANLFVIGTELDFQKVLNDVSKKNGNFRFTDIAFTLLNERREYENQLEKK